MRADENFPAGRHRRPDLSHLPRCPVREALLDNWHRRAQSIVWTCADIVRQFTDNHHGCRPSDSSRTRISQERFYPSFQHFKMMVVKEQMAEQESIQAKLIKMFRSDHGQQSAEKMTIGSSRIKLALLSISSLNTPQPGDQSQGTKFSKSDLASLVIDQIKIDPNSPIYTSALQKLLIKQYL
ncbi:hypothetical protein PSTT_15573 [Puccinia striiformis]|uniref:Uncharacterized protein n=1 Tax=Puccinia striiformis TaxID=27350 RepID=A0A2S4UGY7_9BASI|nr:hypothetical protein PSTT_15573 [Puccinia striiformis]